ncbi:MAG: hypothetical protein IT364_23270 [Candidatus Hydrogenedentes bacterium]|nr:hypothetical protein [Candidatus Hydrogenedentota bacterium]
MFDIECRIIMGNDEQWDFAYEKAESSLEKHKRTVDVDLSEFAHAVEERPDADSLIADYTTIRMALKGYLNDWLYVVDSYSYYYGTFGEPEQPRQTRYIGRLKPFDLSLYEATLMRLPAEFREYILGAAAYYAGDWDSAVIHFGAILKLPENQRRYRSVWAAFMLGKTYLQLDPAKAPEYFELARRLAEVGFRDPLELALECGGWQARGEMLAGKYVQAIHRYAAIANGGSQSLRVVCRRALSADPIDPALVGDDLARRIMTAWAMAHPQSTDYPDKRLLADKWLTALEQFRPEGAIDSADRMAWFCYQRGALDAAEWWLDHCDPQSPYGRWLRSKFLLRSGDLEAGALLLRQLTGEFPASHQWRVEWSESGLRAVHVRHVVRQDLAITYLQQGNYTGVLELVCEWASNDDVDFFAEQVLTVDELKAFVDAPPETLLTVSGDPVLPKYGGIVSLERLRTLLACRLARERRWDEAMQYLSEDSRLRNAAQDVRKHLAAVADESQPSTERGRSLFELGRMVEGWGHALFNLEPVSPPQKSGHMESMPDFQQRLRDSRETPSEREYRYMAADYMWRAAELLPDNDPLTAEALYLGGTYLKKDPKAADRFYKALVRRNPNRLIAQQANQRRWFPKNFTDVVVYQPCAEQHWYDRKRNIALVVLLVVALAMLVGWFVLKSRSDASRSNLKGEI